MIQFRRRPRLLSIKHFEAGTLVVIQELRANPQEIVARHVHVADDPKWVVMALSLDHVRVMSPLELLAEAGE